VSDNNQNFYHWLVGYLDGCDPINLIVGSGCPPREYEPEAKGIFLALPSIATIVDAPRIIREVFISKFGEELILANDTEIYNGMANHIMQAWKEHSTEIFADRDLTKISD
jgi:hypothetical protein